MDLTDAVKLFHDGALALARAERQGIRIDIDHAEAQDKRLSILIDRLIRKFKKTNFYKHWQHSRGERSLNINSNDQLENYLYKVKKIKPLKRTPSKKGSTDEESLEGLGIPELNDLLRIRKLKKLRDPYLSAFINESVNGFMHPSFNLNMATTYRSSSSNPNFQNIPVRDDEARKIARTCIFPRLGHQLLELDYSGLEVCIAACYHQDPTMIKYIKDPASDMHADMAKQIFFIKDFDKKHKSLKELRYYAKNGFVFPQFYGDIMGIMYWLYPGGVNSQ